MKASEVKNPDGLVSTLFYKADMCRPHCEAVAEVLRETGRFAKVSLERRPPEKEKEFARIRVYESRLMVAILNNQVKEFDTEESRRLKSVLEDYLSNRDEMRAKIEERSFALSAPSVLRDIQERSKDKHGSEDPLFFLPVSATLIAFFPKNISSSKSFRVIRINGRHSIEAYSESLERWELLQGADSREDAISKAGLLHKKSEED